MKYVDGFVASVPTSQTDAYRKHVAEFAPMFREFGAARMVECLGDDIPKGKVNDFPGAVQAGDDETMVLFWMEYADKAARDAANAKMQSDPRMATMGESMPIDGKRMIFGGFAPGMDAVAAKSGRTGYVDGFILPVPNANKAKYFDLSKQASAVFLDHGALRHVECWGDDVPDGKITDFRRAAHAKDDETVVFAWIEWPSKAARDAGMKASMEDPRMKEPAPSDMPFDGMRMIFGGFVPILNQ